MKHLWKKVFRVGTTTLHSCCARCFTERSIEQRPRIVRYRTPKGSWVAKMPECRKGVE